MSGDLPPPPPPDPTGPRPAGGPGAAGTSTGGFHPLDLTVMAAGLLAFIGSLLPYYTVSIDQMGVSLSDSATAWHGFFGWVAAVLALAGGIAVALAAFGIGAAARARMSSLIAFGVALICVIIAGFTWPASGNVPSGIDIGELTGHGFGYWLSLIVIIVGVGAAAVRKTSKA
ncbi:MAG: hypothetical protein ACRDQA_27535 [Nocardioidaceae bacterium]